MAMGQMISPGVYTNIIDLSEYLQDIPGTVGFVPILSKRGPDNKLQFVTSKEQFINLYGEPNIMDFGKYYGQGPYVAWQHLSVSSHLYVLRAMPDDATYSHLIIGLQSTNDEVGYNYSSSTGNVSFASKIETYPIYLNGQNKPTLTWIKEDGNPDGGYYVQAEVEYPSVNHVRELETFIKNPITSDYMYTDDKAADVYDKLKTEDGAVKLYRTDGKYTEGTGGIGIENGFLMYFRTIGRGSGYNNYSIKLSRHANPEKFGIYILDIYETQDDGDSLIKESFIISFDENATDDTGESIFIEDVVNKFSRDIRCSVNRAALKSLERYKQSFYKNDPTLPSSVADQYMVVDENGVQEDYGYKALKIFFAEEDYKYTTALLKNALADLTTARNMPMENSSDIVARNQAIASAISAVSAARSDVTESKRDLEAAYSLDILDMGDPNPETATSEPWNLAEGSDGSLTETNVETGKTTLNKETATQILCDAYRGLLVKPDNLPKYENEEDGTGVWKKAFVDEVFDLDWIYFSLVYDAGYHPDVKDAALELCDKYRRDCMLISDCGDNIDFEDVENYVGGNPISPEGRMWNSRYAARFDPYSKVYDTFTGRDLWVTPVYHMAQLIPLNDRLYEIWYASAGFNRGTLSSIKELRWSPKLGERDKLYLLQVNPIVHFPQGYTVWGNLTTQKRPTALQDINCMRLVLYIKRALEQFCQYYIFEFNDAQTHNQIKAGIIPFLDRIRASRGLVDFSVDVGADEYEFKNKICHVNVTLQPMKVIEKIELNLYVK